MKKLLFVLLILLPLSVSGKGKIYAVLVGVSEYQQAVNNLHYSAQDAIEMYDLLKNYAPPENVILLTDAQAKSNAIASYTKQLFQQAQPEDIVIFFFSGHGYTNVFSAYDTYLSFSVLQNIFKQCKAKRKIIFADSCLSGTMRKQGNQTVANNQNMGNNVLLFLSSRSNQYSQEDPALRNGEFTYFLLAGLRGGADFNKDSYVTAKELFDFVNPKVKERTNGSQVPVMWGKFDKNMIILKIIK